jgi:hypothetical protein
VYLVLKRGRYCRPRYRYLELLDSELFVGSSKGSNRADEAPRGFPTVPSPLPPFVPRRPGPRHRRSPRRNPHASRHRPPAQARGCPAASSLARTQGGLSRSTVHAKILRVRFPWGVACFPGRFHHLRSRLNQTHERATSWYKKTAVHQH